MPKKFQPLEQISESDERFGSCVKLAVKAALPKGAKGSSKHLPLNLDEIKFLTKVALRSGATLTAFEDVQSKLPQITSVDAIRAGAAQKLAWIFFREPERALLAMQAALKEDRRIKKTKIWKVRMAIRGIVRMRRNRVESPDKNSRNYKFDNQAISEAVEERYGFTPTASTIKSALRKERQALGSPAL